MKRCILFLSAVAIMVVSGRAAAFRNLDFEEAQTNNLMIYIPAPPGLGFDRGIGTPDQLLPGWQLYQGNARPGLSRIDLRRS
jgi:hypothetical protein